MTGISGQSRRSTSTEPHVHTIWDDLLPYFVKAENFTDDVDADFSRELYIQPNASIHGTDGYVHVSYPKYFYNQSRECAVKKWKGFAN